jgi:hypothetical protein
VTNEGSVMMGRMARRCYDWASCVMQPVRLCDVLVSGVLLGISLTALGGVKLKGLCWAKAG